MSYHNPDQYSEPQTGLVPDSVETDLADFIDTNVLAEVITGELRDAGVPVTLDNAKKVYLNILEELWREVGICVNYTLKQEGRDPVRTE